MRPMTVFSETEDRSVLGFVAPLLAAARDMKICKDTSDQAVLHLNPSSRKK